MDRWPVFVINLKDAADRRETISRQCRRYGIEPTIIEAVDGRRGLPHDLERLVDRPAAQARVGRLITDGEFACAFSHHFIYRRILEQNLPGAVVLEDDAILTEKFGRFYEKKGYLAHDFIQMDHMDARVWRWRGKVSVAGITLMRLAEDAPLATGYSVSADAARYIAGNSIPMGGVADWPCDLAPLVPLVTVPAIIRHPPFDPGTSHLEKARAQQLQMASDAREPARWKRFGRRSYWWRWWFKRKRSLTRMLTRKIS